MFCMPYFKYRVNIVKVEEVFAYLPIKSTSTLIQEIDTSSEYRITIYSGVAFIFLRKMPLQLDKLIFGVQKKVILLTKAMLK